MKKAIVYILCIAVLLMPCSAFAETELDWTLYINKARVELQTRPDMLGNVCMVPVGEICRRLRTGDITTGGGRINVASYDHINTVVVEYNGVRTAVTAGSEIAYGADPRRMDAAPYYKNGELMVPLDFFLIIGDLGSTTAYSVFDARVEINIPGLGQAVDNGYKETETVTGESGIDQLLYYCQQKTLPELIFSRYGDEGRFFDVSIDMVNEIYREAWYSSMKASVIGLSPGYQQDWLTAYFSDLSSADRRQELTESAEKLGIKPTTRYFGIYAEQGSGEFYLDWGMEGVTAPLASRAAVVKDGDYLYYYTLVSDGEKSTVYEYNSPGSRTMIAAISIGGLSEDEFRALIRNHIDKEHIGNPSSHENIYRLPIMNIRAKDIPEPHNPPENAIDHNLDTRYAAIDFEAVFDMGRVYWLSRVDLAFWLYDRRQTDYSVSISDDGVNYVPIFDGRSIIGNEYESHKVGITARYIKVCGRGNTENYWTSLLEIVPYGN